MKPTRKHTMHPIRYIDRHTGEILTERPPGEGFLKFLYHNPIGELTLQWFAKRKFLSSWYGRMMDTPRSAKRIAPFVERFGIDMSEAERDIPEYRSFNDFFYRKLKPGVRPVGEGWVSPGDGKLLAFEHAGQVGGFFIKGMKFTLADYLRDAVLAERFQDAYMVVLRLAPNDYHRFHFPYGGKAEASLHINGSYYSVSPYALRPNFGRVFLENKRAYTLLETRKGTALLSPVGATMVGSIIHTYRADAKVEKGDEMGYFAFGGSSIVLLLPKDLVNIDEDLLYHTRQGMETFVRMGERIGMDIIG